MTRRRKKIRLTTSLKDRSPGDSLHLGGSLVLIHIRSSEPFIDMILLDSYDPAVKGLVKTKGNSVSQYSAGFVQSKITAAFGKAAGTDEETVSLYVAVSGNEVEFALVVSYVF
ncbi:hypothetical protein IEQ34_023835 [Dendrobium chrysotoxum]|uniref:Uncharacterized protein n=1 Tax=Dendrobium chrysotoxum TaxID=161865 RepID=A0AAV7FU40_DENCH|nr:hypothetical protein IEQ34_023835 [Dendrobium chrysotoxum]